MNENSDDIFTIRMVEDIIFEKVKIIEESKYWLQIEYKTESDRDLRIIKNNIIFMEKLKNGK